MYSPRNTSLTIVAIALLALAAASPLAAQAADGSPPFVQVIPHFEIGTLGVLQHTYQVGTGGTNFNFVTQGGQDVLFPYQRYSVEVILAGRHRVTFLYQPLTLDTRTVADRNGSNGGQPVVIDAVSFPLGTPMNITYGFDFWRMSYLYDFSSDPSTILGAGISLQIRNASIVFTSEGVSPGLRAVSQNVGLVPILKVRAAHWFSPMFGLDFEADGFYASSAIFNGATKPFTGWIWDAALSARTHLAPGAAAFLTVRSIGGGASGESAYSYVSATTSTPGTYTKNVLATLAVTLGVSLE
jgi:hypothetical protein